MTTTTQTTALLAKIIEIKELLEDFEDIVQAPGIIEARKNEPSYPLEDVIDENARHDFGRGKRK